MILVIRPTLKSICKKIFRVDFCLSLPQMLFYTLPCVCRVTDEELIPVELFELLGIELWEMESESETDVKSCDGRQIPLNLRCTSKELLSAVATVRELPAVEECGSETRSISHHVCTMYVVT